MSLESIARKVCDEQGLTFTRGVAQGAFKETFEVQSPEGNPLALKLYKPGNSMARPEREIEAMRRCDHPNIAALIDVGTMSTTTGSHVFLLEEFLPGGTLTDQCSAQPLSIPQAQAIASLMIDAIAHIWTHRLVHRDIKPDNIMFRADGSTPVLVDFGLVRDLSDSSLTATFQVQGPGSPYFAAPEQLNNDKALIDWRADQFALAVSLSLATFGVHPYAHHGDDPPATVGRVIQRAGPSSTFRPLVDGGGLPALATMVQPWPIQRYRTPGDLAAAWQAQ